MPVPADELVFLRIAVREGRLDQCARRESDLAGGTCIFLVETERLPNQVRRSPAG